MRAKALMIIAILLGSLVATRYLTPVQSVSSDILSTFTSTPKYTGHVAVERLAKHLTSNETEQKAIADFVYNLENVFHIDPHVLFQNADYLVVTVVWREDKISRLEFIFTNNKPEVKEEISLGENTEFLYWNGKVEYELRLHNGKTHYQSRYEGPSKENKWSGGVGYNCSPDCWHKMVNLKEFDWYQRQQP